VAYLGQLWRTTSFVLMELAHYTPSESLNMPSQHWDLLNHAVCKLAVKSTCGFSEAFIIGGRFFLQLKMTRPWDLGINQSQRLVTLFLHHYYWEIIPQLGQPPTFITYFSWLDFFAPESSEVLVHRRNPSSGFRLCSCATAYQCTKKKIHPNATFPWE
jgi:hypothetical protein